MDMMELFRTLGRWWWLTTLLLLLTLSGTLLLAMRPGPYQTESQVTLLPSRLSAKPDGFNPYLGLSASLTLMADLVRREVSDPRTALALAGRGYPSAYQVTDDPDTAGPVLDVTVTGPDKSTVEHTLYGVTAEVGTRLAAMQARVRPTNRITSLVVSVDPKATLMTTKKLRLPVALFGLGLVITAAIPQVVDTSVAARRARRGRGPDEPSRRRSQDAVKARRGQDVADARQGRDMGDAWRGQDMGDARQGQGRRRQPAERVADTRTRAGRGPS